MKKIALALLFFAMMFPVFVKMFPALASETSVTPAVQSSISFARFGYFADKMRLPIGTKGQIWATPRSFFDGPFHTNDQLHIYLPPGYFEILPQPFFRGPVTSAAGSVEYYEKRGPFDKNGEIDSQKLRTIFGGKVTLGVKPIPLPDDPTLAAKDGALGGTHLNPGMFVYLPHDSKGELTGGIVAAKNLKSIEFQVKQEKPFRIVFTGEEKEEEIVSVDFQNRKTTIRNSSSGITIYTGIPNGAIYVNGNIGTRSDGGITGVVKGRWTVACEGDIFISGNLSYSDTPEGSQPQGNDMLALIAPSAFITNKAPELMYLYAAIFVEKKEGNERIGTLFVLPSPDRDFTRQGELIWWGNYVGEYPAIMGTFDRSDGQAKDGYDLQKYYDLRLATNPPPFFPTL